MPVPIICLDEQVRHFAERFRQVLSKPQYQYFVTVLLGLMECEGRRTLSGLVRQVAAGPSLAGLSRFLSEAPWEAAARGRKLAEALSGEDAAVRGSRPATTTPRATQAPRPSQTTRRDRVFDRGRLDDAQAQGQEDARAGAASFDDGGQTHPRS